MSDKSLLILGCGFTGCELAQRVGFKGQAVFGSTRSDQRSSVIRSRGAEPVLVDIPDVSALRRLRGRVDRAVSCIPPQMARDGSYTDGTAALMEALADFDLRSFVYVSSTSVYGDHQGAVVDERTPTEPDSPRGRARVEIEQQVLSSGLPAMVVRPSGIYGPGRSQLHRLATGRLRLVAGGASITNRIHVHDLAAILEAALERGEVRPNAWLRTGGALRSSPFATAARRRAGCLSSNAPPAPSTASKAASARTISAAAIPC